MFSVHWHARPFYELFYKRETSILNSPVLGRTLMVEFDGNWLEAKIVDIIRDLHMLQFYFEDLGRYEWLFYGSPRIETIWKQLIISKNRVDGLYHFDQEDLCIEDESDESSSDDSDDSDDSDCILISDAPKPVISIDHRKWAPVVKSRDYTLHICDSQCLNSEKHITKYSLFHQPLAAGFERIKSRNELHPYYLAPCGVKLTNIRMIANYLSQTNSSLQVVICIESASHSYLPVWLG